MSQTKNVSFLLIRTVLYHMHNDELIKKRFQANLKIRSPCRLKYSKLRNQCSTSLPSGGLVDGQPPVPSATVAVWTSSHFSVRDVYDIWCGETCICIFMRFQSFQLLTIIIFTPLGDFRENVETFVALYSQWDY